MSNTIIYEGTPLNRREFLNLTWLASLGFLLINFGGVTILFSLPRFREGEFGGSFALGQAEDVFPSPGEDPIPVPKGKFWLSRTEPGLIVALYKVCTHLGCIYNWRSEQTKFICPCHGSQFQLDGTYILGPAPRSCDRFVIHLLDGRGQEIAATDEIGNPLQIPGEGLKVIVETGQLIKGLLSGINYTSSLVNLFRSIRPQ